MRGWFGKTAPHWRFLVRQIRPDTPLLAWGVWCGLAMCLAQLSIPWAIKFLIDDALLHGNASHLLNATLLVALAAICVFVFQLFQRLALNKLANRATVRIQDILVAHLHQMPLLTKDHQQSGEVAALFANDVSQTARFYDSVLNDACSSLAALVLTLVVMFHLYGSYTLYTLVVAPIYLLPQLPMARRLREATKHMQAKSASALSEVEESVRGRREIKAHGYGRAISEHLHQVFESVSGARSRLVLLQSLSAGSFVFFWIFLAILYNFAGHAVLNGKMTIGALLAFVTYTEFLRQPFSRSTSIYNQLQSCLGATDRLFAFLALPLEDKRTGKSALLMDRTAPAVDLRNVSFAYEPDNEVVREVTVSVGNGEKVALVGPSGSGKSTLVQIIAGLYDPATGGILVNGIDPLQQPRQWMRSHCAIVLQDSFLFSGTIEHNVRIGNYTADRELLEEAIYISCADGFVNEMAAGLHTEVGPGGSRLSGGQRARIALARALIRNSELLIVDEATGALDAETETRFLARFARLRPAATVIIVAHRFSIMKFVDKVIVLDKGLVCDFGTHHQMLARCDVYRTLAQLQEAEVNESAFLGR